MKVAIPSNNGEVNRHFGRSQSFTIVSIEDNNVVNMEEVSAAGLQHMHEGLAGLLKTHGVEVVIVGGIGPGALQSLESLGMQVLFGAGGSIKDVAETFARGEFVSTESVCNHHGGHHHHDDGCSHS